MKTPNISKTIATLAVASGLALGANSSLAQEINTNTKKVSNSVSRVLKEDNPSQIEYKLNFETEEARETFDKAIEKVMGKFWYKLNLEKNQLSGNEVIGEVQTEYKVEKTFLTLEQICDLYEIDLKESQIIEKLRKEYKVEESLGFYKVEGTTLSLEQIHKLYMRYIERLERAQRIKKEYKFIERIAEDVSDGFLDTKEEIIKSLKQEIADRKLPEKFKKRIEEIIKNNTKNKNSETDQIKNDIQLLLYEYEDFLYEKADLIIVNTKTGELIPEKEIDKLENLKSWKDIVFRAVIKR